MFNPAPWADQEIGPRKRPADPIWWVNATLDFVTALSTTRLTEAGDDQLKYSLLRAGVSQGRSLVPVTPA